MSDSSSRQQPTIDIGEFERRLRGPDASRRPVEDPLSELARLVESSGDPKASTLSQPASAARIPELRLDVPPAPAAAARGSDPQWDMTSEAWKRLQQPLSPPAPISSAQPPGYAIPAMPAPPAAAAIRGEPAFPDHVDQHNVYAPDGYTTHPDEPRVPQIHAAPGPQVYGEAPTYPQEPTFGQRGELHGGSHGDQYGELGHAAAQEPHQEPYYEREYEDDPMNSSAAAVYATPPPPSRRPLFAVVGAVGAVVLGVGATFAMRGGASPPREAPIITAATGPTKIQPASSSTDNARSQGASVLDRSGDKVATSRIVGNIEQPVDVAAKPVRQVGSQPQLVASNSSFLPEPKRVKTFIVRPDNSIANPDIPVSVTPPTPAGAAASAALRETNKPEAALKATTRVAARLPVEVSEPEVARPVKKPAKVVARPVKTASKEPVAATSGAQASAVQSSGSQASGSKASGSYAVQLGAGATDSEARDRAAQMQSKFSASFGGRKPTVIKGDSNGKTVYRVRIVGLSQDGATALCGKVKGGGGDCFVAH